MNVKELIAMLNTMPPELPVMVEDMEWERHPLQVVLDETMVGFTTDDQEVCLLVTSRSEEASGT